MAGPFHRFESLAGASPQTATESNLQRLVEGSVREADDLDFKREPYDKRNPKSPIAVAGDVAAMANTVNGVIVLGIGEVDGAAAELVPVPLSEDEELRMRSIVAQYVKPVPDVFIHRVESHESSTSGYYVLSVPRSVDSPHHVVVESDNSHLRCPARDGARTRYLSPSEIADRYRNRFELARTQVDRLGAIQDEGLKQLTDEHANAWLLISMVPTLSGAMALDTTTVRNLQEWYAKRRLPITGGGRTPLIAEAGVRRVVLHDFTKDGQTKATHEYVQLYQDGSGFSAHALARWNDETRSVLSVGENTLMMAALEDLEVLCAHAVENANSSGDAIVQTQLIVIDAEGARPREVGLWGIRIAGFDDEIGTRRVVQSPVGQHTIVPSAVVSSARELLLATRLVLADLFQSFGVAQARQIDESGNLLINTFDSSYAPYAKRWAEDNDVLLGADGA